MQTRVSKIICSTARIDDQARSPRLDQFHQLVAADTPQVGIARANGNIPRSLGLPYDSVSMAGVAGTRNRTMFHELDAVAPITQAHNIKIRPVL